MILADQGPNIGHNNKDQFGVFLVSLLFVAALVMKWQYINPAKLGDQSCMICAVFILWCLSVPITLLLTVLWNFWERQFDNGFSLVLILCFGVLCCTVLMDYTSGIIFAKLYYVGVLEWQESHVNYLFDDFIHHSAGIYLATLMLYTMMRVIFKKRIANRKIVVAMGIYFSIVSGSLLVLALKFY
jgi:hypothetical protein